MNEKIMVFFPISKEHRDCTVDYDVKIKKEIKKYSMKELLVIALTFQAYTLGMSIHGMTKIVYEFVENHKYDSRDAIKSIIFSLVIIFNFFLILEIAEALMDKAMLTDFIC